MSIRTITALALACVCAGASAGETITVDQIAEEAGVSRRQVMMVFADRTQYSEYRTSFEIVQPKVMAAWQRLVTRQETAKRTPATDTPTVDATLVAGQDAASTTVVGMEQGPTR